MGMLVQQQRVVITENSLELKKNLFYLFLHYCKLNGYDIKDVRDFCNSVDNLPRRTFYYKKDKIEVFLKGENLYQRAIVLEIIHFLVGKNPSLNVSLLSELCQNKDGLLILFNQLAKFDRDLESYRVVFNYLT